MFAPCAMEAQPPPHKSFPRREHETVILMTDPLGQTAERGSFKRAMEVNREVLFWSKDFS